MAEIENHFTVFVRLPFNRGDFVDPPPVAWSSAKETNLWDVISRQKGNDIDWKNLADKFEVSQAFVLQQAAWLYERQLSQVRAQMRKVGASRQSATPSPSPGSASASMVGGYAMKRGGSGGSRVPSRLSMNARDSPVTRSDDSAGSGTPAKTRTPASLPLRGPSGTNTHSRTSSAQEAQESPRPTRQSSKETHPPQSRHSGQHRLAESTVHESSEDSDSENDVATSNLSLRRLNPASVRPRPSATGKSRQVRKDPSSEDDDEEDEEDEDEDSPAFLPFANTSAHPARTYGQHQDPSATLRGGFGLSNPPQRPPTHRRGTSERIVTAPSRPVTQPQTLTSSASSASSGPTPTTATRDRHVSSNPANATVQTRPPGPLSPHQAAALQAAGLSPRRRPGREGSDGTPSMGSSFSDLDDASVTQSALEEALMSNMGHNGGGNASVASRVSGLSQALRSRYFDAQGKQQ